MLSMRRPKPEPPVAASPPVRSPDASGVSPVTGGDPFSDGQFSRTVLDCVPANVFVADAAFRLVYVNPQAAATLRNLDAELHKAVGVRADQIVGTDLHRLSRNRTALQK